MKTLNIVLSASLAGLSLFALAMRSPAQSPKTAPTASAAPRPKLDAKDIEHTTLRAPAILHLEEGDVDSSGAKTIHAVLELHDVIRYPVTLHATSPRLGKIVEGTADEPLDLSALGPGDKIERTFKVTNATREDPFTLTIGGASANNVVGFRAEQKLPKPAEMAMPAAPKIRPPTGRPLAPYGKPLPTATSA